MAPRILVIDNYDSFVYNLVQYLGELGAEPIVHRDAAITLDQVRQLDPDGILISPGPGPPADAGEPIDRILDLAQAVVDFRERLVDRDPDRSGVPAHGVAAIQSGRQVLERIPVDELEVRLANPAGPGDVGERQPLALSSRSQPFV